MARLPVMRNETHIVPLHVGDPEKCKLASDLLLSEHGVARAAEPSLRYGGRTMGEYSEVFVAFDVAKRKHVVAVAESGRRGEVRFLGEIENNEAAIERTLKNCLALGAPHEPKSPE